MTLLIDNYDSFTYNLYQLILSFGEDCQVIRNDELSIEQIKDLKPQKIVLSPGPGRPANAGVTLEVIKSFSETPILGICLGHQAIGEAFGAKVVKARVLRHGKLSEIFHNKEGLFSDMTTKFSATRYHSLIVERASLPSCFEITCETSDKIIMGIRHRERPIEGLQFHPESFATKGGDVLIKNFLKQRSA